MFIDRQRPRIPHSFRSAMYASVAAVLNVIRACQVLRFPDVVAR